MLIVVIIYQNILIFHLSSFFSVSPKSNVCLSYGLESGPFDESSFINSTNEKFTWSRHSMYLLYTLHNMMYKTRPPIICKNPKERKKIQRVAAIIYTIILHFILYVDTLWSQNACRRTDVWRSIISDVPLTLFPL